ncbi:MAG: TetR/AcrR family transcriptional regulator [Myxococcota bacterium]
MARPVNADASATRQRILTSATLLFSERGAKSSIREIAKDAGVSLAMVHHYFGSKDDLFAACITGMYVELAELRTHLIEGLTETKSIEQLFEYAIREGFRFARAHQPAMRLMMRTVVARGAIDQARIDEFLVPFLEQASKLVSGVTGADPDSLRLPLQSLIFLNGRYAIAEIDELRLVTATDTAEAALAAVENHLVDNAFLSLGLKRSSH